MDQIKIGKFISNTRKELNLTQLELADKLGITDRAVSKWENGRGLPDISLIKPLCDALSISVNELLCGERVSSEELPNLAEENLVSALDYSQKKVKRTRSIFLTVIISVVVLVVITATLFAVDVNRMRNDLPVFFSTWGIDYAPPVDLNDEKIEIAIKDYLVKHGDSEEKHEEGVKTFVALKTYLIEETEDYYNVYTWVLEEQCYPADDCVMNYGSFSMPYKFTLVKENEEYIVAESRYPRDGSYYAEDMKNLFPKSVVKSMRYVHRDGTIDILKMQVEEQVKLYFDYLYND